MKMTEEEFEQKMMILDQTAKDLGFGDEHYILSVAVSEEDTIDDHVGTTVRVQ